MKKIQETKTRKKIEIRELGDSIREEDYPRFSLQLLEREKASGYLVIQTSASGKIIYARACTSRRIYGHWLAETYTFEQGSRKEEYDLAGIHHDQESSKRKAYRDVLQHAKWIQEDSNNYIIYDKTREAENPIIEPKRIKRRKTRLIQTDSWFF